MATPARNPLVISSGEGRQLNVVGDRIRVLVRAADTGGAFAVVDAQSPPGGGPPTHLHSREDEHFYVVEGEVEFIVAGKPVRASAGAYVFAPRNVPHKFQNVGAKPLRMTITIQPAGLERFFEEADAVFSVDGPPDMGKFLDLCGKYGIDILEKPPAK
jgi:quercetin dioxygenase-like cupin family protein